MDCVVIFISYNATFRPVLGLVDRRRIQLRQSDFMKRGHVGEH